MSIHLYCSQVIDNTQEEVSSLLGPWASAPISEDYTFGVEPEFALHGVETKTGLQFGPRSMVPGCTEPGLAKEDLLAYLQLMGVPQGWR
jgi:hypothetical protein